MFRINEADKYVYIKPLSVNLLNNNNNHHTATGRGKCWLVLYVTQWLLTFILHYISQMPKHHLDPAYILWERLEWFTICESKTRAPNDLVCKTESTTFLPERLGMRVKVTVLVSNSTLKNGSMFFFSKNFKSFGLKILLPRMPGRILRS